MRKGKSDREDFIERRIVTGFIVSTEYVREIINIYRPEFLESVTARLLAGWCVDYFNKYNKVPNRDIQGIFQVQVKAGLDKDRAEDIESVLSDLSSDYDREKFNVDYLTDETVKYFSRQHLKNHIETLQGELDAGSLTEAEKIAISFTHMSRVSKNIIDPFTREAVDHAFRERTKPLMRFGKALGRTLDAQFVRDGFVAFMGPEKRGKSMILLEVAMRGLMSGCNVAFFQAGDMSEDQQVRRICTYLARKSTDEKYCKEMLIPIADCRNNQDDMCSHTYREGTCGLDLDNHIMEELSFEELDDIFKRNKGYKTCHIEDCEDRRSTFWFKRRAATEPLSKFEAQRIIHKFRQRYKKQFKLATYANETLTMNEINALLDTWERAEMFVPDLIVIDYADILAPDSDTTRLDYRHQENKKWQRMRSLSQTRHSLLVTATQTDADSYGKSLLSMSNFSETKSKYAHVTAMYGLNQSDREKKIGIMRINEIVVREGDFDRSTTVSVLQRLQIGRPYLGSF